MVVDAAKSVRQFRRFWVADGDLIGPWESCGARCESSKKLLSGISIIRASANSWSTVMGVAPRL